jgi:hypothetical protein
VVVVDVVEGEVGRRVVVEDGKVKEEDQGEEKEKEEEGTKLDVRERKERS